jgi:probable HAF family extracellular repeat protein
VVGLSDIKDDASFHAFLWTRETGMQDLDTLHADDFGSSATGLDDKGNVVGLSIDSTGTPHAFLRPIGGKMIDLNTLIPADSPLFLFQACSINSHGELTGLALEISTGQLHAFFAVPLDSDDDADSLATAEPAGTTERKQVVVTDDVR